MRLDTVVEMSYALYLDAAGSLYDFLGDGVSPLWKMSALKTVSLCSTGKSFHLSSSILSVCPRGVVWCAGGAVCVSDCEAMSVSLKRSCKFHYVLVQGEGSRSWSMEVCGVEISLFVASDAVCMFGFGEAEWITALCKQHLTRCSILIAVKSIKVVVPPGYFRQLLYSWYERWAAILFPYKFYELCIIKRVRTPQKCRDNLCCGGTFTFKSSSEKSREYLGLLLFYRPYSMNLWILQSKIGDHFAESWICLCWSIHQSAVLCQCRWDGARGQKMSSFIGLQSSFCKATIRLFLSSPASSVLPSSWMFCEVMGSMAGYVG